MWICKNCETSNTLVDEQCNSCDGLRPAMDKLEAILQVEKDEAVYLVSWAFKHTDRLLINHGIGEKSAKGELSYVTAEQTELEFIASNKFADIIFRQSLHIPLPIIAKLTPSDTLITLGKPVTIHWETKYAKKIVVKDWGDYSERTYSELILDKSCSITLIAENEAGNTMQSIYFTLPYPEINSLDVAAKVLEKEPVHIVWSTINAQRMFLTGCGELSSVETGKIINLEKSSVLTLTAANNSGSVSKEVSVEVIPRPIIEELCLKEPVILRGEFAEVNWKIMQYSKLYIIHEGLRIDVSDVNTYRFIPRTSSTIEFVCESLEALKTFTEPLFIKVIEGVDIHFFKPDKNLTIQSRPIVLSWEISNATEVILLPQNISIDAKGHLELRPSFDTVYSIVARNELTKKTREVLINVHPLPVVQAPSLEQLAVLSLPTLPAFQFEKIVQKKVKRDLVNSIIEFLKNKFAPRKISTLSSAHITFRLQLGHVEINKHYTLWGLLLLVKSGKKRKK
jgi:hypothetical protein